MISKLNVAILTHLLLNGAVQIMLTGQMGSLTCKKSKWVKLIEGLIKVHKITKYHIIYNKNGFENLVQQKIDSLQNWSSKGISLLAVNYKIIGSLN